MTNQTVFPAVRNWQMSPPAGGWSVTVDFNGHKLFINEHDPMMVLAKARSFARQVGFEAQDGEIEALLNQVWNQRDPSRALPTAPPPRITPGKGSRKSEAVTYWGPSQYGAQIWMWLNTFGLPGGFNKGDWMTTIQRISNLLNPTTSPKTGCAECFNEWMGILEIARPELVSNEMMAAKWVFSAHNKVNEKLGKKLMSWESAASQFGWNSKP